jgi:ubiquinone biosynthesis monooxygenase Coq7
VIAHIQDHLDRLPAQDARSRAILNQMERDEARHGDTARRAGARDLPGPVRRLMYAVSRIMTRGAYFF